MKFRRKESEEISGFLDKGTNVTGELHFSGTLRIDGNFHGSIATDDILVIGEHATVHADIKVGEIEIHGRVCGNIEGKRRVEIHPTGRVRGDIRCPALVVSPGSVFDGRSIMAGDSESDAAGVEGIQGYKERI
jgi:cytoskeletal protein CcmA (bactofilin family)